MSQEVSERSAQEVQEGAKNPWIALLLGYLIPGLGHWYLGKTAKGVFFCLLLYSTFFTGFAMADFGQVAPLERTWEGRTELRYTFIPEAGIGLAAWAIALSRGMTIVVGEDEPRTVPPRVPLGVLYMMVAGLLNILVAQRAYEVAWEEREWQERK